MTQEELELYLQTKMQMCHFLMIFLHRMEKRYKPLLIHPKMSYTKGYLKVVKPIN